MRDGRLQRLLRLLGGRFDFTYDHTVFPLSNIGKRQAGNLLLNIAESSLRVGMPRSYPAFLQLEPTTHCQLTCVHCPRPRTISARPGHMDWTRYEALMREIGPYLIAVALWQWGEPLLHPRMADMVALAKQYGIFTMISTNGQFDDARLGLKELFSAGLDLLIVSLDGVRQKAYDSFRSGGDVGLVRRFIEEAVEVKRGLGLDNPLVNVRIIVTSGTEAEVGAVRDFARGAGADFFSIKSVSLYGDPDPASPYLPANAAYRSFQYRGRAEADEYRDMVFRCTKPWSWPTLRYDGTLLACECDHAMDHALGNVFSASFKGVWRGRKARSVRERFNAPGGIDLDFCRRCRYKINDAIRSVEHLRRR